MCPSSTSLRPGLFGLIFDYCPKSYYEHFQTENSLTKTKEIQSAGNLKKKLIFYTKILRTFEIGA
jgi:hypothetical protein